jgi:hypothetical protein
VAWHGTKWNDAAVYELVTASTSVLDGPAALTVGAILYPTTTGEDSTDNVNMNDWPLSAYNIVNGTSGTDTDTDTDTGNSGSDDSGYDDTQSDGGSVDGGAPRPLVQIDPDSGLISVLMGEGYVKTQLYRIGDNTYEDKGGYDKLGRRFLYGLYGSTNILSKYYRTADGKDDWMEIPFKEARDKFIHLRDALGNQTVLKVTYGQEALTDDSTNDAIYNERLKMFVTVKENLPVPYDYVRACPERISPFSVPYTKLVGIDDSFTMTPMPPNNNKKPDPSDLLKLAPLGDQNNEISNPNEKAYNQDDTSLLYTKNATLGATEVALNKVGAKKGIPQLGTVVIPISQGINSIVNGENMAAVTKDVIITFGFGKFGSKVGSKLKLNPEAVSVFISSMIETVNEKIKNTEKNKDVFKK